MNVQRIAFSFLATIALCATASAEMLDARIGLGIRIGDFFEDPGSGFVQGSTSFTNTMTFDDSVVEVDFTLTAEGFDAGGAPAGLFANNQAVGVEGGSRDDKIDAGETIKITFTDIEFTVIGVPGPGLEVDPSTITAFLSSIRLAAFNDGVDTFTYTGVGDANLVGDDTQTIEFVPDLVVDDGDMFSITADSGDFRGLFLSLDVTYGTRPDDNEIPEPTTLALAFIGAAALGRRRG